MPAPPSPTIRSHRVVPALAAWLLALGSLPAAASHVEIRQGVVTLDVGPEEAVDEHLRITEVVWDGEAERYRVTLTNVGARTVRAWSLENARADGRASASRATVARLDMAGKTRSGLLAPGDSFAIDQHGSSDGSGTDLRVEAILLDDGTYAGDPEVVHSWLVDLAAEVQERRRWLGPLRQIAEGEPGAAAEMVDQLRRTLADLDAAIQPAFISRLRDRLSPAPEASPDLVVAGLREIVEGLESYIDAEEAGLPEEYEQAALEERPISDLEPYSRYLLRAGGDSASTGR